jgi:hypothetical protein
VNGGTCGAPVDLPAFALDPLFRDSLIAISFTSHVFQNDFNVTLESLKIKARDYDVNSRMACIFCSVRIHFGRL